MQDATIQDTPTTPEGMLSTPAGRILPDDGHGRLLQALDEAYELGNAHVETTIADSPPFLTPVGRHVRPDGAVVLTDALTVLPGGAVEDPRQHDGLVAWRGGHVTGDVRTEMFLIDGRAATLVFDDPLAADRG